MSRTIDTFQNFYKEGREGETFRFSQVVENLELLLSETLALGSVKLAVRVEPEDLACKGNMNALAQVLLSLMQNSIHFLGTRNVQAPEIALRIGREEGGIRLEVEDNGGGIDPKVIPHIFDYHVSSREEGPRSTGIGLGISKAIVEEKFRGSIRAKNTDKGALFTILLPV